MNIGEASRAVNLPTKTIRYYEEIDLIVPAARTSGGYRTYCEMELHKLRFVQRARSLGFTIAECRELLDLYEDRKRASADVRAIAMRRIVELDRKTSELLGLRSALSELVEKCHGDVRPDCPILDDLTEGDG